MRRDPSLTTNTLPFGVEASTWVTSAPSPSSLARARSSPAALARAAAPSSPDSVEAATSPDSSKSTAASTCEEISVRSASAWAASIACSRLPRCKLAQMRLRKRALFAKFFADRGTHLAAMVAYFALLSFVPLIFLALSLLGLAHRADASDFLVRELKRAFPGSSLQSILTLVHRVQDNAAALGIIGGIGLLWSSLSLFSSLESAFNIVYGRPNRSFLKGKGLALLLMVTSLVTLFVGLLLGGFGADLLNRYAPGILGNSVVAYAISVVVSALAVFIFLVAAYYRLTNVEQRLRDVLPGAIV